MIEMLKWSKIAASASCFRVSSHLWLVDEIGRAHSPFLGHDVPADHQLAVIGLSLLDVIRLGPVDYLVVRVLLLGRVDVAISLVRIFVAVFNVWYALLEVLLRLVLIYIEVIRVVVTLTYGPV